MNDDEDPPPDRRVHVGGQVQNSTVSLRVFGDDLDPAEVTRLLGSPPTVARRKGEIIAHSRDRLAARTGSWSLKSQLGPKSPLDQKIETLLDRVTSEATVWRNLTARYSVDLFCGVFLDAMNRSFELPAPLVARLAERGLSIVFDLYGPTSEEEDWSGADEESSS
jgi:hypothetical protein